MYKETANIVGNGAIKVIVLSGWLGHARSWQLFEKYLDRDKFTFAFFEQRGYGHRKDEGSPFDIETIANESLLLANELGWDDFSLVGHSMGACGIQQILINAPQRVKSMIAITPVPARGVAFSDDELGFFRSAGDNPQTRRQIIDFTTQSQYNEQWLDEMLAVSLNNSTPEAVNGYFEAWSGFSQVDAIEGNPIDVLVIAGGNDPAQGEPQCKETWLQYYPNATLSVIDNVGHYPMDESPERLATLIQDYLKS